MEHRVDLNTVKNEFDAARALLRQGALEGDIMVTHRNGEPSMRGSVGWWAAHCTVERPDLPLHLAKYRPFTRDR